MKNIYTEPEMNIISLVPQDVITDDFIEGGTNVASSIFG